MPQSSHSAADLPVHVKELFSPSREFKAKWNTRIDAMARSLEEALRPSPIQTHDLGLLVRPAPMIIRPPWPPVEPGIILCAPKLVLNEVTRYLSWEERTWKQRVIEEAERAMLGPVGWQMWEEDGGYSVSQRILGIDTAIGNDRTVFTETLWSGLAKTLQLPTSYLTGRPASSVPNLQNIPIRAVSGDKNDGGLAE